MTTIATEVADATVSDAGALIGAVHGGRDGKLPAIPDDRGGASRRVKSASKRFAPKDGTEIASAECALDIEDNDDADSLVDANDLLMVRHMGKIAVVHDFAISETGGMYLLSIAGPAQVCTGIFAALVDQGSNNSEVVKMEIPGDREGGSIVKKDSVQIRVHRHAVGSMRHIKNPIEGGRRNLQHSLIFTDMLRFDFDYRHIKRPDTESLANMGDAAKVELQKSLSRFVLLEDVERGESEEALALRWYGFLTRRVQDGLLQDWALPLWRHCLREGVGVTPLARIRGGAAADRDRALDELLERGVLRAKASSGCE